MAFNIVVPDLGESVVEATILSWLKQPGQAVSAGEAVVELETEKVTLEVSAERAGVLMNIAAPEGADVKVGDVLGIIEEDAGPTGSAAGNGSGVVPSPAVPAPGPLEEGAAATPVARKMAEANNVDLAGVAGSGPRGKVTKVDVQRALEGGQPAPGASVSISPLATGSASLPRALAATSILATRREERTKMSRRRQTIARRLIEAQQTAAILTTFNEIDMSAVMAFRNRHKEAFREKHGVGLGLSSFFVKATIGALKQFPAVNAEIQGTEIVYKYYYDIGVAIGAEEGLIVPVLRDADGMTFAEIERRIKEFAKQAEEGTVSLDDLRGGTFTITNGGVFGSLLSTPILNPPQVGILGMHTIQERPVVVNGEVVIRPMMYVALSYDHRIIDGREAVQFLVTIKKLLEDVEQLMLEG